MRMSPPFAMPRLPLPIRVVSLAASLGLVHSDRRERAVAPGAQRITLTNGRISVDHTGRLALNL